MIMAVTGPDFVSLQVFADPDGYVITVHG